VLNFEFFFFLLKCTGKIFLNCCIIYCLYLSHYNSIIIVYIKYLSPPPPPPPPSSSAPPTPHAAFDALSIGGERGGADFFRTARIRIASHRRRHRAQQFSLQSAVCWSVSRVPDPGFRRRRRVDRRFFANISFADYARIHRETQSSRSATSVRRRFFKIVFPVSGFRTSHVSDVRTIITIIIN